MKDLLQDVWKEQILNDKNAIIIDVRRPNEWKAGIIKDAVMMNILDVQGFQQKALQLDSSKNYYVYCRSGVRSVKACSALKTLGLKTTYNLVGGILKWKDKTVLPT